MLSVGLLSLIDDYSEVVEELEAFIPYGPYYIPREMFQVRGSVHRRRTKRPS